MHESFRMDQKMNTEGLLKEFTSEIYEAMLGAVETGRWPNGQLLTQDQRDHAMQLVMLYQSRYNHQPQHMTINVAGQVELKPKSELKAQFKSAASLIAKMRLN
jgi:uncharacterized protein YeaC (DUF1315 family)